MGEFNIYCIFSSVILIFFKTYYIRKSVYNFCIARCNILYSAMQNFVSGNAKYDKRLFLLKNRIIGKCKMILIEKKNQDMVDKMNCFYSFNKDETFFLRFSRSISSLSNSSSITTFAFFMLSTGTFVLSKFV